MMTDTLSPTLLQEYPVWKWDDSQDWLEPVLDWESSRRDEPTYIIKADFIAVDGTQFEGYLIGLDTYYAFGLFVGENEHILNFNLPDRMEERIKEISEQLHNSDLTLFPLRYTSEVRLEDDKQITGIFSPE
jgi:hypothetical protein